MEQRRRTINSSSRTTRNSSKKVGRIIALILGLAIIFTVAFTLSSWFLNRDNDTETTQSTQEDIANMSREELENKYTELKKALEEKEKEIDMLKERLENSSAESSQPVTGNDAPSSDADSQNNNSEPKNSASDANTSSNNSGNTSPSVSSQPPAASSPAPAEPFQNSGGVLTPEELAALEATAQ